MKKAFSTIEKTKWIFQLTLCIISILSFMLVFLLPRSSFLKTISVSVRYNNIRFLLISSMLLLLAFSIKNTRWSTLATALVVFPVFALALNGVWASAYTDTNTIAGIMPRRDAFSYYSSSMALIEKGYLMGYTRRRPLFAAFFAVMLSLCGKNLQIALAAITFFAAAASFFALVEVRKTLNPLTAIIFFIPQFLYFNKYTGNVMSETLGYSLGMIALSFFLMAFHRKRAQLPRAPLLFLCGVFLYSLSQFARPGAIATLPLLVLFSRWLFRGNRKLSWKIAGFAVIMIFLPYLANSMVFNALTKDGISQYNNVGNGVYGVVSGGTSWAQIHIDYPDINSLAPGAREKRITEVIIAELINHPENFIKGMRHQLSVIFSLKPISAYNIYSYMLSSNYQVDFILITGYYILSIIGIIYAAVNVKKPVNGFILLLLLGFLLSLPVTPAYQSQFMRYYTATIPLLGLLPALGLTLIMKPLARKFKFSLFEKSNESEEFLHIHNGFAIFITCLVVIAPFFFIINPPGENAPAGGCLEDEREAIINYYPGSGISVIVTGATWAPNISIGDFRREIHSIPDKETIDAFEAIPLPATVFPTIDLITEQRLYVVLDMFKLPEHPTVFKVCGVIDSYLGSKTGEGVFYPRTIEEF